MPFWAVSLETFEAEHPDELPLERGDTVLILGDDGQGQGWLQAFKGDTYGFVPEVTDSRASASALPFIPLHHAQKDARSTLDARRRGLCAEN